MYENGIEKPNMELVLGNLVDEINGVGSASGAMGGIEAKTTEDEKLHLTVYPYGGEKTEYKLQIVDIAPSTTHSKSPDETGTLPGIDPAITKELLTHIDAGFHRAEGFGLLARVNEGKLVLETVPFNRPSKTFELTVTAIEKTN